MARGDDDLLQAPIIAVRRVVRQRSRAVQSGHHCSTDCVLFHPSVSQAPMFSSNCRGAHVSDGISPARKIIPRTHEPPRQQISRAFIPPCIHNCSGGLAADRGLPLSDLPLASASRNPRRTLLYRQGASRVPDAAADAVDYRNGCRNQDLRVDSLRGSRRRSDATAGNCTVRAHSWNALHKIDSTTGGGVASGGG
jgi:hypothetical protein